jgi:hypothetical protein
MNANVRVAMASMSAGWALRQMGSSYLATRWGVSAARARHLRTDDIADTALCEVLSMILDPRSDGEALVVSALESLELRYVTEAERDRKKLEAQMEALIDAMPDLEADERRAWMKNEGVDRAMAAVAKTKLKILALRKALGINEEAY